MASEDTFVEITNHDIFNKLVTIEKKVDKTNGNVKLNKWIASTALSLVILVIGFFLNHVIGG